MGECKGKHPNGRLYEENVLWEGYKMEKSYGEDVKGKCTNGRLYEENVLWGECKEMCPKGRIKKEMSSRNGPKLELSKGKLS